MSRTEAPQLTPKGHLIWISWTRGALTFQHKPPEINVSAAHFCSNVGADPDPYLDPDPCCFCPRSVTCERALCGYNNPPPHPRTGPVRTWRAPGACGHRVHVSGAGISTLDSGGWSDLLPWTEKSAHRARMDGKQPADCPAARLLLLLLRPVPEVAAAFVR